MNVAVTLFRVLILAAGLSTLIAAQEPGLVVPALFTDHMVLQRDMPVPVWGSATPGAVVTVTFRAQTKSATAGADGKWLLKLDPLSAGGPDNLTINTLTIADVLVGEVWVGSGQSNMAIPADNHLFASDQRLAAMTAVAYPQIRLFTSSGGPHDQWKEATAANNPGFSATLFSFGVPLQHELNVPVGLVVGAVGGTPSGYWLSEDAYRADPACLKEIADYSAAHPFAGEQQKYAAEKTAYDQMISASAAVTAAAATPAASATATGSATKAKAPPPPPPQSPVKAGETSTLQKIGHLYEAHIRPLIPFAIRGVLWDQGESGTALVGVDQYTVMGVLIRSWRHDWGQGDFPFIYVQKPSGGGPAWDYADPVTAKADAFMQLPGKGPRTNDASGPAREMDIRIMTYPNTFMATSSDLGGGTHPTNKSGYGEREARVAMGAVYGKKIEIYGPIYQSQTIEDGKIRIQFTHIGAGLAFRNGTKLQGFAIAGEDRNFVWADATIDGASVVVSSPAVPKPVAVRYAWSGMIPWANLFNQDGLPAQAFRTDTWEMSAAVPPTRGGHPASPAAAAP